MEPGQVGISGDPPPETIEIMEQPQLDSGEVFSASSLRLSLPEATSILTENIECFSKVIGMLQESALDAASKGNKYIHTCLRLNEEMRGLESLAMQLYPLLESLGWFSGTMKTSAKNVDSLDLAVTRLLQLP